MRTRQSTKTRAPFSTRTVGLWGCSNSSSGGKSAVNAVTTLPAMSAESMSADHSAWMSFTGNQPSPVETAVTSRMRVLQLMCDTTPRSWFNGASCKPCVDSAWIITQKNMDQ